MAISAVKIVNIIGVMDQFDSVVRTCGASKVFHPEDALSFYSDTKHFTPIYEDNPYRPLLQSLKSCAKAAQQSLELQDVSDYQSSPKELSAYVNGLSRQINTLMDRAKELVLKLEQDKKSAAELAHFLGLNLDLKEIFACKYTKVRFGRLPRESYERLEAFKHNPYVLFFQCTSDKTHYWGGYFAPLEYADEVDRIFSSLYFERTRISATDSTPEEKYDALQGEIAQGEEKLREVRKEIGELWEREKPQVMRVYSKLEECNAYFGIRKYAAKYNQSFILAGWIPADGEKQFRKELERVGGIEYSIENADEAVNHQPPVKLKNKRLFKPFEFFVDMYGLPSYHEVDPTPFVAITYILLFGIMFGDLGQGLVLSLVGWAMWRMKQMPLGRILIRCGVSSAFFGLVYGSVFGFEDALNPFYRLLGFAEKPVEVMQPATTNLIIYMAVGIGVVLVMIAMMINIYSSIRRKNLENALFGPNGVAGLIFYIALVAGLVCQMLLGLSVMNAAYVICLIVLPLLVIFFREPLGKLLARDPDWKPEKWGDYVMQNFFELFETVLSYVTNTMSFLRVGAFVLVHAGMMLVVFTLAEMTAGPFYLLILVVGNLIVMGLEGLLVGIQVLRLEFYEMFSRFFEGQGRPFLPVVVRKTV